MPLFAFLFHATQPLSEAELNERARVVPSWMLRQRDAGRVVTISVFGERACHLPPASMVAREGESELAGCTLVEAESMDDALALAREFPGRAFGTEIEVRPVKTFVPPPAAA